MNQILSTDIEKKNRKKRNKASINTIIIIFSVILIIFGIGTTGSGAYSYYKCLVRKSNQNLLISNSTKPIITIERQNTNTISLVVSHDREIKTIIYTINDDEEKQISGSNRLEINEKIKLKTGSNHINITAKDIYGISSNYETDIEVEAGPVITLIPLESDGKIKVVTESEEKIDNITYYWDEDVENKKVLNINDNKNETLIDVSLEGVHILHINATDVNGNTTEKTPQKIKGVNKPKVEITTDGQNFIIKAKDEIGLSKIEITLNSNETIVETIEGNEYTKSIKLENGENKLTVNAYNKNNLSQVSRVKFTKEQ